MQISYLQCKFEILCKLFKLFLTLKSLFFYSTKLIYYLILLQDSADHVMIKMLCAWKATIFPTIGWKLGRSVIHPHITVVNLSS